MEISIFGLDCVSVDCLAVDNLSLQGVTPNATKADLINQGNSTILKPELHPMISWEGLLCHLRVFVGSTEAIVTAVRPFVFTGIPSTLNGTLDLRTDLAVVNFMDYFTDWNDVVGGQYYAHVG